MKKLIATLATLFLLMVAVPTAATAMPCNGVGCPAESTTGYPHNVSCALVLVTPAVPEVLEKAPTIDSVLIPAVTETVFEYVHKNPNHPNSPRWEAEGWNADDNPNSGGWTSTGNTEERVITPEKIQLVEIEPGMPYQPAIPAVTREECITEVVIPEPTIEPVVTSEPSAPVAPVAEPVAQPVAQTSVVVPAEPTQQVSSVEKPEELAYTGANPGAAALAVLCLALGIAAIRFSRKIA